MAAGGQFNPGTAQELKESGSRTCGFIMGGTYLRCDWRMKSSRGREREITSYHNYNHLYDRYESLYIASNWPTKVIGTNSLRKLEHGKIQLDGEIRFTLPNGKTEYVRSAATFGRERFEVVEQIRITGDDEDSWRVNYQTVGTRVGH